jgi:hypothetical protein
MSILNNHLKDIDAIKEQVKIESEKVLDVIDLKILLKLDTKGKHEYLREILLDMWETQKPQIIKSWELGEKKAKAILNAIN